MNVLEIECQNCGMVTKIPFLTEDSLRNMGTIGVPCVKCRVLLVRHQFEVEELLDE